MEADMESKLEAANQHVVDKSKWGPGPWQSEMDRYEWRYQGIPCLIVRGPSGALCGYAAVTEGHPWHGKGYSECVDKCGKEWCHHTPESIINVHGGLTFADRCDEGGSICHVPQAGEPDKVWWFGFDCAHCGDISPKYSEYGLEVLAGKFGEVYRDVDYVRREVHKLADQLLSVGKH